MCRKDIVDDGKIRHQMKLLKDKADVSAQLEMRLVASDDGQEEFDLDLELFPGAAGERYTTPCADVHPRGIGNWISASNETFGVTLSSTSSTVTFSMPTRFR